VEEAVYTRPTLEKVNQYMLRVYNYMVIGLGISGLTAWFVSVTPALMSLIFDTALMWVVMLAPLVMIFFFYGALQRASPAGAQMWFWIFAFLEGLMLSTIFGYYTGESIVRVFFITSAMFAGLSLYGYTTKLDMSGLGKFLFIALIGLIILMITNIFLGSAAIAWWISVAAVALFAALIAYDTQRIRDEFSIHGDVNNAAVQGALSLYLDFLNMFIYMLHLFGIGND